MGALGANRISIVQRMRPIPDKMNNAWTIGMDSWRMVDNAPSVARSARSVDTCFAKVRSLIF
jgi:hypothetical protein